MSKESEEWTRLIAGHGSARAMCERMARNQGYSDLSEEGLARFAVKKLREISVAYLDELGVNGASPAVFLTELVCARVEALDKILEPKP